MKRSLWFVVPAHGRHHLTAICLRQLRRTCDALVDNGVEATAVVIACDENLGVARELGFGTVERDNRFLSRRFNDGLQLACDPAVNPRPADYAVPCGSDDWIDHRILDWLPPPDAVLGFQNMSFVRPDGRELTSTRLGNVGGCGIRVYPRQILERLGYRPADEDRYRACDTSILTNLRMAAPELRVEHRETGPLQIVDWKSDAEQLNGYDTIYARHRGVKHPDPFAILSEVFDRDALAEMADHYSMVAA